jgi:membrane protease YdiL (CAAX protease family)
LTHEGNNSGEDVHIHPSLLVTLAVIGVSLLFMLIVGVVGSLFEYKRVLLVAELLIILPAVAVVVAARYPLRQVFRLHGVSPRVIGSSIIIALSTVILIDEIDRLVGMVFPMPDVLLEQIEQMLSIHSVGDGVLVAIFAVVVAGICEEMLFRGFLQQAFERVIEVSRAVVICSLVFAFIHLNPWTTIQILIIGVLLGILAWRSNSAVPSAIVHIINNGLSVLLLNLPADRLGWYVWRGHVHPLFLVLGAGALCYGIRLFFRAYED